MAGYDRDSRPMEWYTKNFDFSSLASAAQNTGRLYSAQDEGLRNIKGATITRIIVDVGLRAESVAQLVRMFWGILIVSAEARIGLTLPDADDMSDRHDWLVRGRLFTIQDSLSDSSQWAWARLDLRAQRIMRSEEDELVIIFDAGSDGFTMERTAFVRTLVRLP